MNFEYTAFLKVSRILKGGFKHGIKTLCQEFHSQLLITEDILQISTNNADDPNLSDRVVNALLERVRNDRKAFMMIVRVLHKTTGIEYLAKALEEKLAEVQEEHMKNVEQAQLDQARRKDNRYTRTRVCEGYTCR